MGWTTIGRVRVDDGALVVGSPASILSPDQRGGVDAMDPIGVGVDLQPRLGVSGVLVPTGFGDGVYDVEVETAVLDGRETVLQMRVRFVTDVE